MDMLGSASSLGLHGFGAAAAAGTAAGFTDHLAGSLGLDGHTASAAAADFMGHHAHAAMPHAAAAYTQHHHQMAAAQGYHHHHHPHQNAAYGSLYQSHYPGFTSSVTAHQSSDSHHHSQVLTNCSKKILSFMIPIKLFS